MTHPVKAALAALWCLFFLTATSAQSPGPASPGLGKHAVFSLITDSEPVMSLAGLWRFHPGDDARWADPGLADDGWPLLRSDRPWNRQGYPNLTGYGWYRFTVEEPGDAKSYSLLLPRIYTAYQVFVNGHLTQTVGRPGAEDHVWTVWPLRVDLPRGTPGKSQVTQIALRVWRSAESGKLGGSGGPVSGRSLVAETAEVQRQLNGMLSEQRNGALIRLMPLFVIHLLAGIVALALFARNREQTLYLWFAAFNLLSSLPYVLDAIVVGKVIESMALNSLENCFIFSGTAALIVFYRRHADAVATVSYRFALAGLLLLVPLEQVAKLVGMGSYQELVAVPAILPLLYWSSRAFVRGQKSRASGRGWISGAVLLWCVVVEYSYIAALLPLYAPLRLPYKFSLGGFEVDFGLIGDAVLTCWISACLVDEFARRQREQSLTEVELRRAKAVQQLLIPDKLAAVPWCCVEATYLPAQEVSGDFFQVVSVSSGELLVVLGDVAGKGMPAALTVSLLVGAVRALAEQSTGPSHLLASLNQVLSEREMAMTTCLALCFAPNGKLRLASAGHPPPYWNGRELDMLGALPLGVAEGSSFEESTVQLQRGDHLLLLTDGVPEATGKNKAMLGWERTRSLSTESASSVALAAQRFGQSDDITVLTVSYTGAREPVY